jgi:Tol biopolymer transport system component
LDEQDKPGGVSPIRISVTSDGTPAAGGDSANPAISDDGRFVVFQSRANNLIANDTNGVQDIFLHDRDTDEDSGFDEPGAIATIRVSVDSNGNPAAGGDSTNPAISGDGQYVVFESLAHNLVNGKDDPGIQDIFVHDRDADEDDVLDEQTQPGAIATFLMNVDSDGNPAAGGHSTNPAISDDGRYVVFQSISQNLVNGKDDPGIQDIFVHDRDADEDDILDEQTQPGAIATFLMNVDSDGNPAAGGDSTNPAISANGRHVVFQSISQSLVDDDDNGLLDIFVHDRDADDDLDFDEQNQPGAISTVRTSVRTVELSSSGGTLTAASSRGSSGGGGSCFISAAGHESSVVFVWLLLSVILGAWPLMQWKSRKTCLPTKGEEQ